MEKEIYDVLIIGAGPAGYTSAIYASRAGLNVALIAGDLPGGQLMLTTEVENYPGFEKGILGPKLMQEMLEQAKSFGTEIINQLVTKVEFTGDKLKKIITSDQQYQARSVIIATGASAKWLKIPGEQEFMGKGVSACATCDGYFFRGKRVIVVGGGDTAMEEALHLAKFATEVTLIHRNQNFKASKIMLKRVQDHPKITLLTDTVIEKIYGEKLVEGVVLNNTTQTAKIYKKSIDGVFVAIGHSPNSQLFAGKLELDSVGYIITSGEVFTNVPGVFVAGDIADSKYRQAITAAGSGCKAAIEAERYLQHQ